MKILVSDHAHGRVWTEAGDYLVYLLTGRRSRSGSIAGDKAFYK